MRLLPDLGRKHIFVVFTAQGTCLVATDVVLPPPAGRVNSVSRNFFYLDLSLRVHSEEQGKDRENGKEGEGRKWCEKNTQNKFLVTVLNTTQRMWITAPSCFWTASSLLLASASWLCACALSFCIWVIRFCSTNTSSTCWQHEHQHTPLETGQCRTLTNDLFVYDIDTTFSKYCDIKMSIRYFLVSGQCLGRKSFKK